MGGSGYEFAVEIEDQFIRQVREQKPSLLKRLFRSPSGIEAVIGEVASAIREDLRGFIERAMPEPWEATRSICKQYLFSRSFAPVRIGVRHNLDEDPSDRQARVAFTLSGCAGAALVSAWLGAHWIEIWFQREHERIRTGLLPRLGLKLVESVESLACDSEQICFFPANMYCYARFDSEGFSEDDKEPFQHFYLDGCWSEGDDDASANAVKQFLTDRFTDLMRDGRCRCQLCCPDFDANQLQGLP